MTHNFKTLQSAAGVLRMTAMFILFIVWYLKHKGEVVCNAMVPIPRFMKSTDFSVGVSPT
jgi:hypothetical protein